jgi:hypothetical protein
MRIDKDGKVTKGRDKLRGFLFKEWRVKLKKR